jgi:putative two-component system response regulator
VTGTDGAVPRGELLIVDDQEQVRDALSRILASGGYRCRQAASVAEALVAIEEAVPDLVLCDIDMPVESGLVLVERLHRTRPEIAVLMVTAFDDPDVAEQAMEDGALGYVIKPFERNEILIGVAGALRQHRRALTASSELGDLEEAVAARTAQLQASIRQLDDANAELDRSHEETLRRLAGAAEWRDPETAHHLERMSRYAEALGRAAGLAPERCEELRLASPMHDVGKIGIPDELLMKEGIFTAEDRRLMQRHTVLGYDLLKGSDCELMELAATVAYTHHEWVDGSGYPRGLRGDEIPVEGRIVAIADVFDALTSARRYKPAFSEATAIEMMVEERGTHFDAELLDQFLELLPEIRLIRATWPDDAVAVA